MDNTLFPESKLDSLVPTTASDLESVQSRIVSVSSTSSSNNSLIFQIEANDSEFTLARNISLETMMTVKYSINATISDTQFIPRDTVFKPFSFQPTSQSLQDFVAYPSGAESTIVLPLPPLQGHPQIGWYSLFANVMIQMKDSQVFENMYPTDILAWIMLCRSKMDPKEWALFQSRIGCNMAHPSVSLQGADALDTTAVLFKKPFTNVEVLVTKIDNVIAEQTFNADNMNGLGNKPPFSQNDANAAPTFGHKIVTYEATFTFPISLPLPMNRKFKKNAFPLLPLGPLTITLNANPTKNSFYINPTFYDVHLNPNGLNPSTSNIQSSAESLTNPTTGMGAGFTQSLQAGTNYAWPELIDRFVLPRNVYDPALYKQPSTALNLQLNAVFTANFLTIPNGSTLSSYAYTRTHTIAEFLPRVETFAMMTYSTILLENVGPEYLYGLGIDKASILKLPTVNLSDLRVASGSALDQAQFLDFIRTAYTYPTFCCGEASILWRMTHLEPCPIGRPVTDSAFIIGGAKLITMETSTALNAAQATLIPVLQWEWERIAPISCRPEFMANLGYYNIAQTTALTAVSATTYNSDFMQTISVFTDLLNDELLSDVPIGLAVEGSAKYTQNGREIIEFVTPVTITGQTSNSFGNATTSEYPCAGLAMNTSTSMHNPPLLPLPMSVFNPQEDNASAYGYAAVNQSGTRMQRSRLAMSTIQFSQYSKASPYGVRPPNYVFPSTILYKLDTTTLVRIGVAVHRWMQSMPTLPFIQVPSWQTDTMLGLWPQQPLMSTRNDLSQRLLPGTNVPTLRYQTDCVTNTATSALGYALYPIIGGGYQVTPKNVSATASTLLNSHVIGPASNLPSVTTVNTPVTYQAPSCGQYSSSQIPIPNLDIAMQGIYIRPNVTSASEEDVTYLNCSMSEIRMNFTLERGDPSYIKALESHLRSPEGLQLPYISYELLNQSMPSQSPDGPLTSQYSTTFPLNQSQAIGFTAMICAQNQSSNFPLNIVSVPILDMKVTYNDQPLFTLPQGIPAFALPQVSVEYLDAPSTFPKTLGQLKWIMPKVTPPDPLYGELNRAFLEVLHSRDEKPSYRLQAWNTILPSVSFPWLRDGTIAAKNASINMTLIYSQKQQTNVLHPRLTRTAIADYGAIGQVNNQAAETIILGTSVATLMSWDSTLLQYLEVIASNDQGIFFTQQGAPPTVSTPHQTLLNWFAGSLWQNTVSAMTFIPQINYLWNTTAPEIYYTPMLAPAPPPAKTVTSIYYPMDESGGTDAYTGSGNGPPNGASFFSSASSGTIKTKINSQSTSVTLSAHDHSPTGTVAVCPADNNNLTFILFLWQVNRQILRLNEANILSSVSAF